MCRFDANRDVLFVIFKLVVDAYVLYQNLRNKKEKGHGLYLCLDSLFHADKVGIWRIE